MKRCILTSVLLSCACVLFSTNIMENDLKTTVKTAEIVGVGVVGSVDKNTARCSETVIAKIKVRKLYKGSLDGKQIRIQLTYYTNPPKTRPLDEDCPSVSYSLPPIKIDMKPGTVFVFTAGHFKGYDECYVTSAVPEDRLDEILLYANIEK